MRYEKTYHAQVEAREVLERIDLKQMQCMMKTKKITWILNTTILAVIFGKLNCLINFQIKCEGSLL